MAATPDLPIAALFDGADPVTGPYFSPDRERIADPAERDRVADFLRDGTVVLRAMALDRDAAEPARGYVVPAGFRTDGIWIWNDALGYYVRTHGIAPPEDFYRHVVACGYRCPRPGAEAVRRAERTLLRR